MGSIALDVSKVNSYVLPILSKSKTNISSAYNDSNLLKTTLPNSFSYKPYINEITNQIYNLKLEINNVESMISKKIERASSIENRSSSKSNSITSLASKIGEISGTIGGAVAGGVIGNNVGKTIVDTGAKVVTGAKNIFSKAWEGIKNVGTKIVSGVKTAAKWCEDKVTAATNWVSNAFSNIKEWTCKAIDNTGAFISKAGTTIWNGLKSAWNWVTNGENWKKLGASIANGALSFVKGLVSLIEAIGDLAVIIGGAVGTVGTALYDIGNGIITGNWNWNVTKDWWNNCVVPVVAYDWTSALDKSLGWRQYFDQLAYEPFKSDGMGCQVVEGIGYIAGVIALTAVTCGAGSTVLAVGGGSGVVVGSAAASVTGATITLSSNALVAGGIAAVAGMGKNTAAAWNDGASVLNGLTYGVHRGLYDGFEMTLGYGINGLKIFKGAGMAAQVGNTASHVALDTIDGGSGGLLDPIFTMIYSPNEKNMEQIMKFVNYDSTGNKINDKTWDDLSFGEKYSAIFNYKGGWKTVGTQAMSAGAMSFLSEIPELRTAFKISKINATGKLAVDSTISIASSELIKNYESNGLDSITDITGKTKNGKQQTYELYKKLGYDSKPIKVTTDEFDKIISGSKYGKIYRGISGDNAHLYIDQFKNGDMYIGGTNGAVAGSGIYTCYGIDSVAKKYATNAGENNGEIIEMALSKDAKVIDFDSIAKEQDEVLSNMAKEFKKYSYNITDVDSLKNNLSKITNSHDLGKAKYIINLLENTGHFAALRGYDAIDVVDKKYLVILNRGKVIVSDSNIPTIETLSDSIHALPLTKNIDLYKKSPDSA